MNSNRISDLPENHRWTVLIPVSLFSDGSLTVQSSLLFSFLAKRAILYLYLADMHSNDVGLKCWHGDHVVVSTR
ncbi:Uncharacterized protein TCM_006397 [Theobroma cacao]|uniref:Uncharacterized protein n=1 Tax=Theobroma cacao TaxID=3641 RepID=A0A061DXC1_THECC|nr:Uncharacterized protein TCM_006397 [Theobroma cacao]